MAKSNRSYIFLGGFLLIVSCIVFFVFWIYDQRFDEIFPTVVFGEDPKRATYGVIGDFFGGILNPILTFCGFVFLIYTILQNQQMLDHSQEMLKLSKEQLEKSTEELALNRQEMELSRNEMEGSKKALEMQAKILEEQAKTQEIQRFENTFFNLLNLFENAKKQVINQDVDTLAKAFDRFYRVFQNAHLLDKKKSPVCLKIDAVSQKEIQEHYKTFIWGRNADGLLEYFSVIYQIFNLVDASNIENKLFYIELLRAQLSRYELIMLFYHCVSDYGEDKILPLARKYDFLKYIEKNKMFLEHVPYLELFKPEPPQKL